MIRYLLIITLFIFYACSNKKDLPSNAVNEKIALLKTDEAFSEMSVEKGMKAAFLEFIDSNGVLLKPNHLPIIGANAIEYIIERDDTSFIMNWQPHNAFVSKSADFGYTYGVYAVHPKNMDTVIYGNYVSIWKKQVDGNWKFVLDSGNEGIDSTFIEF